MICTFFGHRDAPIDLKGNIKKAITNLIENGIVDFYVGNNGNFDFLVQAVLLELLNENKSINCRIVLSYLGESALCGNQELTIFPEELDGVIRKFAIPKRNEYLIKKSTVVVCYVENSFSNSYKWVEKARKKGHRIINLAEYLTAESPLKGKFIIA